MSTERRSFSFSSIEEQYRGHWKIVSDAGKRMVDSLPKDDSVRKDVLFGDNGSGAVNSLAINWLRRLYFTDKSEDLGFPETVYHVTGASAIGNDIYPSEQHSDRRILTDRGPMLHILPRFVDLLGFSLGDVERLCFASPTIDPDQIAIIERISRMGSEYGERSVELFFDREHSGLRLSNLLSSILNILKLDEIGRRDNKNELIELVDVFVEKLWLLSGLREGWLKRVEDALLGSISTERADFILNNPALLLGDTPFFSDIDSLRYRPFDGIVSHVPQLPIVLEIDTNRVIEGTSIDGLLPVYINGVRPFGNIFVATRFPWNSVRTMYVHPDMGEEAQVSARDIGVKVADFDEFGHDHMLGGILWGDAPLDRYHPLCATRYDGSTPISALRDGLLAPVLTLRNTDLLDFFGPEVVGLEAGFGRGESEEYGYELISEYVSRMVLAEISGIC